LWSVNYARIVAKLEHPQHSGKYGKAQEFGETLEQGKVVTVITNAYLRWITGGSVSLFHCSGITWKVEEKHFYEAT